MPIPPRRNWILRPWCPEICKSPRRWTAPQLPAANNQLWVLASPLAGTAWKSNHCFVFFSFLFFSLICVCVCVCVYILISVDASVPLLSLRWIFDIEADSTASCQSFHWDATWWGCLCKRQSSTRGTKRPDPREKEPTQQWKKGAIYVLLKLKREIPTQTVPNMSRRKSSEEARSHVVISDSDSIVSLMKSLTLEIGSSHDW